MDNNEKQNTNSSETQTETAAENENENEKNDKSDEKVNIPAIIICSILLIGLIVFAMVKLDGTSSGGSSSNGSSNKSNISNSRVYGPREGATHEHEADPENETEAPTAKNYISIVVSHQTITIDGKEYSIEDAVSEVEKMGSDYGAKLTDDKASLITMTDLIQALAAKGIIYEFE